MCRPLGCCRHLCRELSVGREVAVPGVVDELGGREEGRGRHGVGIRSVRATQMAAGCWAAGRRTAANATAIRPPGSPRAPPARWSRRSGPTPPPPPASAQTCATARGAPRPAAAQTRWPPPRAWWAARRAARAASAAPRAAPRAGAAPPPPVPASSAPSPLRARPAAGWPPGSHSSLRCKGAGRLPRAGSGGGWAAGGRAAEPGAHVRSRFILHCPTSNAHL